MMNINYFLKKKFYTFFYKNKNFQLSEKNLVIKGENKNWVLNQLAKEYKNTFTKLFENISYKESDAYASKNVHIFFMSKYYALKNLKNFKNKIYFPFFHGSSDLNTFKDNLHIIKKNINNISKIQVSNSRIENFFLENNIPKEKFMRIPITIEIEKFNKLDKLNQKVLRNLYKIPKNAFVIGSFQKDGDGWGKGNNPKLIKGPDILIKTIKILKTKIPELFVLLSGPSRGFVKNELEKINVNYNHINFENYDELINLYKCIDVYLITSRDEGGPRAIMESLISRIPLVTTNVGQAIDIIKNDFNAFKVDQINEEILADTIYSKVYSNNKNLNKIINNGYVTAINNSYESQINLWREFFNI